VRIYDAAGFGVGKSDRCLYARMGTPATRLVSRPGGSCAAMADYCLEPGPVAL
jgi:hypothetical protein